MISKREILEWHYKNTDECGMGCDADEWHKRCWRCGYVRSLEKCHVIPRSLDGDDMPKNYVLLCNECHQEAPNVDDEAFMMDWIRDTSISVYDSFWILRDTLFDVMNEVSIHFGQDGMNKSTQEWALKEFYKRIGEERPDLLNSLEDKDGINLLNSLKYSKSFILRREKETTQTL